jgi:putative addiction module CopG family antidote
MTIRLTHEQSQFIHAFVQTGAFRDEIQVIDEALQLLRQREELRHEIQVGIDDLKSGHFRDYGEDELDKLLSDVAEIDEQRDRKASRGE